MLEIMFRRTPVPMQICSLLVSGATISLVLLLALIELPVQYRHAVITQTPAPGIDYRFHLVWRRSPESIARELADTKEAGIERTIEIPDPLIKSHGWIARRINGWYSFWQNWRKERKEQSERLASATDSPFAWDLVDVGLTRNGQPLDLSTALKQQILHTALKRDSFKWAYLVQEIPRWSSKDLEQKRLLEFFGYGVEVEGDREVVWLSPFLLILRAGQVEVTLGGDGRWDEVPVEHAYLRDP
jgi:hypothetical protein